MNFIAKKNCCSKIILGTIFAATMSVGDIFAADTAKDLQEKIIPSLSAALSASESESREDAARPLRKQLITLLKKLDPKDSKYDAQHCARFFSDTTAVDNLRETCDIGLGKLEEARKKGGITGTTLLNGTEADLRKLQELLSTATARGFQQAISNQSSLIRGLSLDGDLTSGGEVQKLGDILSALDDKLAGNDRDQFLGDVAAVGELEQACKTELRNLQDLKSGGNVKGAPEYFALGKRLKDILTVLNDPLMLKKGDCLIKIERDFY